MADNKGVPASPPPPAPTVADVLELVRGMQANIEKMGTVLSDGIQKAVSLGIAGAAMAREAADINLANARRDRQNLGAACHKCRMPVKVCGGPEMKAVPVLDADGKPEMKDGKPVTKLVEATKPGEEDANHVKMVVMPDDPNAARWFQFIAVNGIRFASRRHGHAILVPRKNDFASILNVFSNFEHEFRQSRKVRFNAGKSWAPKPIHFAGKSSPMGARMRS